MRCHPELVSGSLYYAVGSADTRTRDPYEEDKKESSYSIVILAALRKTMLKREQV
jgi:hypothetical protein